MTVLQLIRKLRTWPMESEVVLGDDQFEIDSVEDCPEDPDYREICTIYSSRLD